MDAATIKNKKVEIIELLSSVNSFDREMILRDLHQEIDNNEFWKPRKKIKIFITLEGQDWYVYSFGNGTYLHKLLKKVGRASKVKKRSLYVGKLDGESMLSFKQLLTDILPPDRKFIFI